METLKALIEKQQKGHENSPRYMIGEQLKEIAEQDTRAAELLEQDLQIEAMNLEAAEKHFQKYADEHHGKERCFCITPKVAEDLLRKFYGLPEKSDEPKAEPESQEFIDLSSFL